MALPPRPKGDFYIVVAIVAFIAIASIGGIVNFILTSKNQGAGPQPTSA